jgi:hypothetical protein
MAGVQFDTLVKIVALYTIKHRSIFLINLKLEKFVH